MIDADGRHIFERSVACQIEDILACLCDVPAGQYRVGFESGAMSRHLYYGLRTAVLTQATAQIVQISGLGNFKSLLAAHV